MGWFSNSMTNNRIQNSATIVACGMVLQANQNILEEVNRFTAEQISRGNQLSGQAFSINGASSALGRQLQQAVGELNTFQREASAIDDELAGNINLFNRLVEQFELPRAARVINASGKEMVQVAAEATASSITSLMMLRDVRENKITESVNTIDRADRTINPQTYRPAALRIPDMSFRDR